MDFLEAFEHLEQVDGVGFNYVPIVQLIVWKNATYLEILMSVGGNFGWGALSIPLPNILLLSLSNSTDRRIEFSVMLPIMSSTADVVLKNCPNSRRWSDDSCQY